VLHEIIERYNEVEDKKMYPLLDNSDESMLGKGRAGRGQEGKTQESKEEEEALNQEE
jgi:hypothetical protein